MEILHSRPSVVCGKTNVIPSSRAVFWGGRHQLDRTGPTAPSCGRHPVSPTCAHRAPGSCWPHLHSTRVDVSPSGSVLWAPHLLPSFGNTVPSAFLPGQLLTAFSPRWVSLSSGKPSHTRGCWCSVTAGASLPPSPRCVACGLLGPGIAGTVCPYALRPPTPGF